LGYKTKEKVLFQLKQLKMELAKQNLTTYAQFDLPKRLWHNLLIAAKIPEEQKWANLTKNQLLKISTQLTETIFTVNGKSTFKEEFVTAGGINLKEVNFKTFESKIHPNLFFAGEVLNIDAITGGFNFQNAWTGGFLAAMTMAKSKENEI
jgi:predicted Rossmann fold flavoprotein